VYWVVHLSFVEKVENGEGEYRVPYFLMESSSFFVETLSFIMDTQFMNLINIFCHFRFGWREN